MMGSKRLRAVAGWVSNASLSRCIAHYTTSAPCHCSFSIIPSMGECCSCRTIAPLLLSSPSSYILHCRSRRKPAGAAAPTAPHCPAHAAAASYPAGVHEHANLGALHTAQFTFACSSWPCTHALRPTLGVWLACCRSTPSAALGRQELLLLAQRVGCLVLTSSELFLSHQSAINPWKITLHSMLHTAVGHSLLQHWHNTPVALPS